MEKLIEELRTCAATLNRIADTLSDAPNRANATEEHTPEPTEPKPQETAPTLEEVRTTLAELSRNGLTAEVRDLIKRHGADRLSGLATAEYASVLKEAKSLGR